MGCGPYREALSARLDGESGPVGSDELDRHLAGCASCRTYAAVLTDLHRRVRVAPAEPVPDLTADVLAAVGAPRRVRDLRAVLALTGIVQLAIAVPLLVSGSHATREAAVFELALAIGFLFASWRPRQAAGLIPVTAAMAVLVLVVAAVDVVAGQATLVAESTHLLQVVGAGMLWVLHTRGSLRSPVAA